eukprot:2675442-Prymnesium_polylepis.1
MSGMMGAGGARAAAGWLQTTSQRAQRQRQGEWTQRDVSGRREQPCRLGAATEAGSDRSKALW